MTCPQTLRPCMVVLTISETERVQRLIDRLGCGVTMRRLGLGETTFSAARGYGRMMKTTRERVLEALVREEAAP